MPSLRHRASRFCVFADTAISSALCRQRRPGDIVVAFHAGKVVLRRDTAAARTLVQRLRRPLVRLPFDRGVIHRVRAEVALVIDVHAVARVRVDDVRILFELD